MLNIGIVLLVEAATGSYAIAGAVAATFAVIQAAASPQLARLVDRLGQARVTVPMLAVHLELLALVLLAQLGPAGRCSSLPPSPVLRRPRSGHWFGLGGPAW